MNTKYDQIEKGDSCWNKVGTGEPLFILRAQDQFAPELVERWADLLAGAVTLSTAAPDVINQQTRKVENARLLATDMRAFQAKYGSKVPD